MSDTKRTHSGLGARIRLVLYGLPMTVFGGTALLYLAVRSPRLPDPPRIVNQVVPIVDLTSVASGTYSLPVFGLFVCFSICALVPGVILLLKAATPDASVTMLSRWD